MANALSDVANALSDVANALSDVANAHYEAANARSDVANGAVRDRNSFPFGCAASVHACEVDTGAPLSLAEQARY